MIRFYGLKPRELKELDTETYSMLWQAITRLEAQDVLIACSIATFPSMSQQDRSKFHRAHYEKAYPDLFNREKPSITLAQLKQMSNTFE